MRKLAILSLAVLFAVPALASADEKEDAAKTFKEFTKFMHGGAWTMTDEDGNKMEHQYRWAIKAKFLQLRTVKDPKPSVSIIGIDPESGDTTWWGYNANGSIGKSTITTTGKNEWTVKGGQKGGPAEERIKGVWKVTRIDPYTLRVEGKTIIGGKEPVAFDVTWKRAK